MHKAQHGGGFIFVGSDTVKSVILPLDDFYCLRKIPLAGFRAQFSINSLYLTSIWGMQKLCEYLYLKSNGTDYLTGYRKQVIELGIIWSDLNFCY